MGYVRALSLFIFKYRYKICAIIVTISELFASNSKFVLMMEQASEFEIVFVDFWHESSKLTDTYLGEETNLVDVVYIWLRYTIFILHFAYITVLYLALKYL